MGVEIKLSDRDLPVSPALVDFLYRRIHDLAPEVSWVDQISETLVPSAAERDVERARGVADEVIAHPVGQRVLFRVYELFTALLTGNASKLADFHRRFRFVVVIGCPRHGGTYLTKQLFRSLGHDPEQVPNVIAHDGFPDSAPFRLEPGFNSDTATLLQIAEYLAMVEVWFEGCMPIDGRIIVPKKATKAAYRGGLFRTVFGPDAEYLVTLRHPLAACISTYEKSGGLPGPGLFESRGNIEQWIARDLAVGGLPRERIAVLDYVEAYLAYWRLYHLRLVAGGLAEGGRWSVVAYGRERLMRMAERFDRRWGGAGVQEEFQVRNKLDRHPRWGAPALATMTQVGYFWNAQGLPFPHAELEEGW